MNRRLPLGLAAFAVMLALPYVVTDPSRLNLVILVLMAAQIGVRLEP